MGWVIFEVFLAFGLAIFIVWWTLPTAKKKPTQKNTVTTPEKSADHNEK